jgi:tetratricopeptide (TPR) repeat protein
LISPPSGDNQKARVTQWIGPVEVTINYSSPDVHDPSGKDRTGHIWGELAHYGFIDQQYGTSKAAPWRAGANENTTISFSHDVSVGGKSVKAGTYGLFLDLEKSGPWYWILSSNANAWGSYYYDPKNDVVRVMATPTDSEYTEWLTFGFDDRKPNSAFAYIQWEKKRVGFKIEVPTINDIYVTEMRNQLVGTMIGNTSDPWRQAAQFCADNKFNLDEASQWADMAISGPYVGQENFQTLSTKASVWEAMGRTDEATTVLDKAIKSPTASLQDIHQYGRTLLMAGKNQKAMEVFKYNYAKHPEDKFTTNVGMARGYTALGDKKNAIKHWEVALQNVPEQQKANIELFKAEVEKLKK